MLDWTRKGQGPDVVLVHGFLGSGKTFDPLTEHLIRNFAVTTIDLPGFAGSYDVPVPPTVEDLSLMVADTIQSIGIRQCAILGHSLGAMISLELSLQQPELLEKMVIYGGCPDGSLPERFESFESSINQIRAEGFESAAAAIVANWFQRGSDDPMFPQALAAGTQTNDTRAIAHIKTWDPWKARDRLGDIQTPALIICGDSDRATHPDLSIEMWNKIPRSQLAIVPNAGHAAHLESPQVFNAIVERFLL
jgi:2-hydroxy-6-oxonona-2,4-dienedioate hydrolase